MKKLYIAYFLVTISVIMLTVPLIPHHHHSNGIICMRDDIKHTDCCHNHHQHDDPCCTNDCLTHFELSVPAQQADEIQQLYSYTVVTLFIEPFISLLTLPDEITSDRGHIYIESLHGAFIIRATGLRAPPYVA